MNLVKLVDRAIELDRLSKTVKSELEMVKNEIQTAAVSTMDDRNLKYFQIEGSKGVCSVTFREKFEIDNYNLLKGALGTLLDEKVTRKFDIKFDVDSKFKKALIVLYNGDFKEADIKSILGSMGLNELQIKSCMKKLKGDYVSDKALLEGFGVKGDIEEELDVIRGAINYELVERYFGKELPHLEDIRRACFVDSSLAMALSYSD